MVLVEHVSLSLEALDLWKRGDSLWDKQEAICFRGAEKGETQPLN